MFLVTKLFVIPFFVSYTHFIIDLFFIRIILTKKNNTKVSIANNLFQIREKNILKLRDRKKTLFYNCAQTCLYHLVHIESNREQ